MPHVDALLHIKIRHDGEFPASWLTGDLDFQKAKVIAAVAWQQVKDEADPDLLHSDLAHQERCIGVVESLMRGNDPDPTPFAQAAFRLWKEVETLNTPKEQHAHA